MKYFTDNSNHHFLQRLFENRFWCIPYLGMLLFLMAFAWLKPTVGWDVIGYTGSALELAGVDSKQVHHLTYSLVERAYPNDYRSLVTDSDEERVSTYRSTMASNQQAFEQQLPYYTIRPLYVGILASLYSLGFSPASAILVISLISSFAIGILIYKRLIESMPPFFASICASSLLLCFRMAHFAGTTTVDPFLGCIFIAFIFHFEKGLDFKGVLFYCLLLVGIRSNAVVFTFPLLMIGYLNSHLKANGTQLKFLEMIVIMSLSILLMKLIESIAGNYGWWTVFYFTFVESILYPADFHGVFEVNIYLQMVLHEMRWLLSDRYITAFYAFVAIMLLGLQKISDRQYQLNLFILLGFIVILISHFLLFPALFIRFFFPIFLVTGVYAMCLCGSFFKFRI